MKLQDKLDEATINEALAWEGTSEKFTFCIDELDISSQPLYADKWVDALEARYRELLLVYYGIWSVNSVIT